MMSSEKNLRIKKQGVYEARSWMRKISADNRADMSELKGMPLYKDGSTGKTFVNINDLK